VRLRRFERAAFGTLFCLVLGVAITTSGGHAWGNEDSAVIADGNTQTTGSTTSSGTEPPTWQDDKIVLTVDPSYTALPYAREALAAAVLAWTSVASELPVVEIVESGVEGNSLSGDENKFDHRISFAPLGEARANGALAITLVTVNTDADKLVDADIIVNGGHCFTDVTTYSEEARFKTKSTYDLQNVLVHELGHWFGLGENYTNPEASMYAYVDPFETKKRDLSTDDVTAVQLAYWHADNPNENTGCHTSPHPQNSGISGLGYLAAAIWILRYRNRPKRSHLST
jgi:hypothetical protein